MILSFLAAFDEAQGTFLVGIPNYITMPTEMYTLVLNYPEQVGGRLLDPARRPVRRPACRSPAST